MKCTIIGSFRQYYDDIKNIIPIFENEDIQVLSPKCSKISKSIENFVIFDYDNKNLTPTEIQMLTFEKIFKSSFVYVYNPRGYIGKTTCYEIGVILKYNIPLFFYEMPDDLPCFLHKNSIKKPEQLVEYIKHNNKVPPIIYSNSQISANIYQKYFKEDSNTKDDKKNIPTKNIVICGSMKFYSRMLEYKELLEKEGIPCIIPKKEDKLIEHLSKEEFNEFKRKVSNQYLATIRNKYSHAVLIVNEEKLGKKNYIGANTLVEIAMAFCWNRKIYLLNDIYKPLEDELIAWNAYPLKRDIFKLINEYKKEVNDLELNQEKATQLSLIDWM